MKQPNKEINYGAIWLITAAIIFCLASCHDSYNKGYKKSSKETIILCIEQPKQCKTVYDYLKISDNSIKK